MSMSSSFRLKMPLAGSALAIRTEHKAIPINGDVDGCIFDIPRPGACSHDFMAASSSEIAEVGRFLAIRGVGNYLPITVTEPIDAPLHAMDTLADVIGAGASGGIDCRSAS